MRAFLRATFKERLSMSLRDAPSTQSLREHDGRMMKRTPCFVLLAAALCAAFATPRPGSTAATTAAPAQYDIVIRNGRVVDGTGRAAFAADLGIKGDRVSFVGRLPKNAGARREINARGMVVAPGFIDMLGQSEQNVLIDPRAMSKVMMGVTTEVTGEGGSIAPTNERLVKEDEAFYRRYNLDVDWRALGEYFARLERRGSA
jgi:N-acyl-D-amino-acid deacylase